MNQQRKTSKYIQIAEYFKDLIVTGKIVPGEQLLTESQIVDQFKCSRHTVRQALMELENHGYIYKEQGKGTFCSYVDKDKNSFDKTIAVLTTYMSNYIFPSIISGIEDVLSSAGYSLLLFNTNNEKNKEREYLQKIIEHNVVGLIVEPTMSALENVNLDYYNELEKRKIPYIMINAKYDELDSAYVVMDDIKGSYISTKYLIQLGHTNIAGIFKNDDLQGVNRKLGYLKALSEFNIPIDNDIIGTYVTKEEVFSDYEFITNLLKKSNRPTAIVCYNDEVAVQALQAVRDNGLKVPEDISIVSYDDSDMATATEVKLTTIRHPKGEMGRRAARGLIDMIEGRVDKTYYVYEPELIVRNSTMNVK